LLDLPAENAHTAALLLREHGQLARHLRASIMRIASGVTPGRTLPNRSSPEHQTLNSVVDRKIKTAS